MRRRRIFADRVEEVARRSAPRPQRNDALAYLRLVKLEFQDNVQKYDDFLAIIIGYRQGSIDARGVASRVRALFVGHPHLILGFNVFLPVGYENEIQDGEEASV